MWFSTLSLIIHDSLTGSEEINDLLMMLMIIPLLIKDVLPKGLHIFDKLLRKDVQSSNVCPCTSHAPH